MTLAQTLLLGFLPGAAIVLAMPIGRLRRPAPLLRLFLNALAIGILLFLVWDVLTHAWEPVDAALGALRDGTGDAGPVFGFGLLFLGGLAVGLLGLAGYEAWMARSGGRP